MQLKFLLSIFICAVVINIYSYEIKPKTAVTDFTAQNVEQKEADIISERLRLELINTNRLNVIEKPEMKAVLNELGFKETLCSDKACLKKIGRLLGVSYIISGKISKIGDLFTIQARITDVYTGDMIRTVFTDCKCPIEDVLTKSVSELAGKIVDGISEPAQKAEQFSKPVPDKIEYGAISISTDSAKCLIALNDSVVGNTPYVNNKIKTGIFRLRLSCPDYKTILDTFTLAAHNMFSKVYAQEHTQKYNDYFRKKNAAKLEMENQKITIKKKKNRIKKITNTIMLGSLSVGLFSAGVLMNPRIEEKMTEKRDAYKDYKSATDNFDVYKRKYNTAHTDATNYEYSRNILYGFSGGFGIFCIVSIFPLVFKNNK